MQFTFAHNSINVLHLEKSLPSTGKRYNLQK
jgi:hypothetical protein